MAGRVLPVLLPTRYDLSALPAGTSAGFVVAPRIDVSQYVEATLVGRLHPGSSITGADALAAVGVYADGHTEEDPAAQFFYPLNQPLAAALFTANDSPPAMYTSAVSGLGLGNTPGGFGGLLAVVVQFQQASAAAGSLIAVISADLVIKCTPHRKPAQWRPRT